MSSVTLSAGEGCGFWAEFVEGSAFEEEFSGPFSAPSALPALLDEARGPSPPLIPAEKPEPPSECAPFGCPVGSFEERSAEARIDLARNNMRSRTQRNPADPGSGL